MRTFPAMVDMKRDVSDKIGEMGRDGLMMSGLSDLPDYDCGLCISFNKESLAKLSLDNGVHVGDFVHIHAFAKVTGVNMQPGSDEIDRVSLCLTNIAAEDEDEEGQESANEAA